MYYSETICVCNAFCVATEQFLVEKFRFPVIHHALSTSVVQSSGRSFSKNLKFWFFLVTLGCVCYVDKKKGSKCIRRRRISNINYKQVVSIFHVGCYVAFTMMSTTTLNNACPEYTVFFCHLSVPASIPNT